MKVLDLFSIIDSDNILEVIYCGNITGPKTYCAPAEELKLPRHILFSNITRIGCKKEGAHIIIFCEG